MKTQNIVYLSAVLIAILYLIIVRPFSYRAYNVRGKINEVYVGGVNDIIIKLEHDPKRYFINRGAEKGLSIELIKLLGSRTIQITTKSEAFNFLDLGDNLKEIDKIKVNDSIYYSETPMY